ncbi:MAG: histidine phosphatase family protein [Ruminococcaceae bacterium]|nr:histidine phosphatase family protein [Oscillospiraceae bacterium]
MIFYYIRHGDPIYNPDSLTPLGERQAEAVAKRLALHGLDKIYSSPSNRAKLTAQPTCEMLKKQAEIVDFANEGNAWKYFTTPREDGQGRTWLFQNQRSLDLFAAPELRALGDRWFDHPELKDKNYAEGVEWIYQNVDKFFLDLGYEHERYTGRYKIIKPNNDRVALFAHQGMGIALISTLLDIPYPQFCSHFDIGLTGMTVIEFREKDGYAIPKVLTYSSDSHIYREGLPTKYNNYVYI